MHKSESRSSVIPEMPISDGLGSQIPNLKVPLKKRCLEDIHKVQKVIQQSTDKSVKNAVNKENFDISNLILNIN